MADGKGCVCGAYGECECACDADWTPQELIDARAEIARLRGDAEVARLRLEAAEAEIDRLRLTDEDRVAVDGAVWDYGQYADEMGLSVAEVTERQNTLRNLLERMK